MSDTVQLDFLRHPESRDMLVSGTFHATELYDFEYQAGRQARELREATLRADDPLIEIYTSCLAYIVELKFYWTEDTPANIRSLESWWVMVKAGKPLAECYLYLTGHVHGAIIRELRQAVTRATRLWATPDEKPFTELTAEEVADPN